MEPTVVSTDVLVIGGGHAALRAALEAARQGVKVTVVDKGCPGRSSISTGDRGGALVPSRRRWKWAAIPMSRIMRSCRMQSEVAST